MHRLERVCLFGLGLLFLSEMAMANLESTDDSLQLDVVRDPSEEVLRRESLQDLNDRFEQFELPEIVEGDPDFNPPAPGDGPLFTVERFDINESEILNPDRLSDLLAEYTGRPVYLSDIYELLERLNERYRALGYVTARAYIPEQRIENGVVRLLLVEGRVGAIEVDGTYALSDAYVRNRIGLRSGDLVSLPILERSLIRFNRLNNSQLSVRLAPGAAVGETALRVQVREDDPFSLMLLADNEGALSTGYERHGAVARIANLFGRDDPLVIGGLTAEGSDSIFSSYEIPVALIGTRFRFSGTETRIRIVDGPLAQNPDDPVVRGETQLVSAGLSQPFLLSQRLLARFGYRYDGSFSTTTFGAAIAETDIHRHSIGAGLEFLGDRGVYRAEIRAHQGEAQATLGGVSQPRDRFSRVTFDALVYHRLTDRFAVQARFSGQASEDVLLPSAEQFSIGGIGSVRAYESGAFAGDDGYQSEIEVQYAMQPPVPIPLIGQPRMQIYGFYEYGRVFPFQQAQAAAEESVSDASSLSAAGLGVRVSQLAGLGNLQVSYAWPLDAVDESRKRSDQVLMSVRLDL